MNSFSQKAGWALALVIASVFQPHAVLACLWDSDTLIEERITNPKMASAIFDKPPKPDVRRLSERIAKLEAARRDDDPAWWNDLAGAYIRLGESETAVSLLEPLLPRFPKDYGLHANLGTAYHLLGRYRDAEREIARDLEINPDAHFGLERYHLALLQYLVRDEAYQRRHVYVDELTEAFLAREAPLITESSGLLDGSKKRAFDGDREAFDAKKAELQNDIAESSESPYSRANYERQLRALEASWDLSPAYRSQWDLGGSTQFEQGVVYLVSLNRDQPACWVMLGIANERGGDLNLAVAAYRRALDLDSPQAELLNERIDSVNSHISQASLTNPSPLRITGFIAFWIAMFVGAWRIKYVVSKRRRERSLQCP